MFSLLFFLGLFLQDLLDNLLLFDQESSDDSFLDTVTTSGTTVRSAHRFVTLLSSGEFSWSKSNDTWQTDTTVTTLWGSTSLLGVLSSQNTTWGLNDLDLVGLGVV